MSKLQILGATRVAALQKMLDKEYNQKIAQLKEPERLSHHDAIQQFEDSHHVDIYGAVNAIHGYAKGLQASGINSYTLCNAAKISVDDLYSQDWETDTFAWKEYFNKRKQLEQERDELKNRLWLCETLEEAKEIVGVL